MREILLFLILVVVAALAGWNWSLRADLAATVEQAELLRERSQLLGRLANAHAERARLSERSYRVADGALRNVDEWLGLELDLAGGAYCAGPATQSPGSMPVGMGGN